MTKGYEAFEKEVGRIQKDNEKLLSQFKKYLVVKGLSEKTIRNHVGNVDFYINEYLCYYDPPSEAKEGVYQVYSFLGDWFVRKAMWASPAHIKSNAASFKKFYAWMVEEIGAVEKSDYEEMCAEIKSKMPEWLENAMDDEDFDWF